MRLAKEDKKAIGERLKTARKTGLLNGAVPNQEEFGKWMNLNISNIQGAMSKWETGRIIPPLDVIKKYSEFGYPKID